MTHFFSVNENEMSQLVNGTKTFDILKFSRAASTGDTIIYQLEEAQAGEDGEEPPTRDASIPDEYSVKINFLFDDSEGALKKGYCAVGFQGKE